MMIFFLSEIYDDRLRRIFGFLFTWALSRQVCTVLQEAQRTLGWAVQCTLGLGPNVAKEIPFGAHSDSRLISGKTLLVQWKLGVHVARAQWPQQQLELRARVCRAPSPPSAHRIAKLGGTKATAVR